MGRRKECTAGSRGQAGPQTGREREAATPVRPETRQALSCSTKYRPPPPLRPANSKTPAPADLTTDATQCHEPQSGPTKSKMALPPSPSHRHRSSLHRNRAASSRAGAHASVPPEAKESRGNTAFRPRLPRDPEAGGRGGARRGHAAPAPSSPALESAP